MKTFLKVNESYGQYLKSIVQDYQKYSDNLLKITFTTLADYFYYLKEITLALKPLKNNAMLYLAAAVSDFYVPSANIVSFFFFQLIRI